MNLEEYDVPIRIHQAKIKGQDVQTWGFQPILFEGGSFHSRHQHVQKGLNILKHTGTVDGKSIKNTTKLINTPFFRCPCFA